MEVRGVPKLLVSDNFGACRFLYRFANMDLITVESVVATDLETVWNCFIEPGHIRGWNFASDDWHCPEAESDFRVGGKFMYKMAAKDGSFAFDYWGYFRSIEPKTALEFALGEDLGESRWVRVEFSVLADNGGVRVVEQFVPEDQNPLDMQRMGWQLILDNFKKYCESLQGQ